MKSIVFNLLFMFACIGKGEIISNNELLHFSDINSEAQQLISISDALPYEGKEVIIKTNISNKNKHALKNVTIEFHCQKNETREFIGKSDIAIGGGAQKTAYCKWTPHKNGFYELAATLFHNGREIQKALIRIPVLKNKIYIYYYHQPLGNKYFNYSLCSRTDNLNRLLESKGITLSLWMPGICYKGKTSVDFFNRWESAEKKGCHSISIDELSPAPSVRNEMESMRPAFIKLKEKYPKIEIITWTINVPGEEDIEILRKNADLIIVERYYSSFVSYGGFDKAWASIKANDIANKTIFGLGLGKSWITHSQELESQFKYIKKLAPKMPGIAIFGDETRLRLVADDMCLKYFIKPVIQFFEDEQGIFIKNTGGMDAFGVKISKRVPNNPSHIEQIQILKGGVYRAETEFDVLPSDEYTILK